MGVRERVAEVWLWEQGTGDAGALDTEQQESLELTSPCWCSEDHSEAQFGRRMVSPYQYVNYHPNSLMDNNLLVNARDLSS